MGMIPEPTIQPPAFKRYYAAAVALLGWFGLILQLYLLLTNETSGVSLLGRFFNFFSYFTILTNILVALCLTLNAVASSSGLGKFFRKDSTQAALTVYILTVGIIYYLLLRNIWKPQGWHFIADATLHYAMPFLYLIYWLLFIPKGKLKFKYAITWMIYPGLYFIYSLIRGAITHWYPYPFIDATINSYADVFKNAGILFFAFAALVFIFILLDKLFSRRA
jgi:hypothetical protein